MRFLLAMTMIAALALAVGACDGDTAGEAPSENVAPGTQEQDADTAAEEVAAADPAHGGDLFDGTCAACHGPRGEGVEGLGKDMTASEFIAGLSDEELLAFLKQGRPPGDPLNTTGVDMPPKGGNPVLNDDDLRDIVAFVRELQQ